MPFRSVVLAILITGATPLESNGQTLLDAFELLGIYTTESESTAFDVNREYINPAWKTKNADFDTLVATSFPNPSEIAKSEDVGLALREIYITKGGSVIEFIVLDSAGALFLHRWFNEHGMTKEIAFNRTPDHTKFTTEFKPDKSDIPDSVIYYVNDVRKVANKLDTSDRQKPRPLSDLRIVDGKIMEAKSRGDTATYKHVFGYRGKHIASITTYRRDKPNKKIGEILFDDHGLIITRANLYTYRSRWEYAYVYDTRGRWITKAEYLDGRLFTFYRRTLSSTVGSEAWNSRDLKSRPH